MSEQNSMKTTDLNNVPRGTLSIRGLPLSRNTRLPSIRSPRDLTLGAQPKRVFTPNIPIRREKKVTVPNAETSTSVNCKVIDNKSSSFNERKKKQPRNVIQTESSLFGSGLASVPHKEKRESAPRLTSSKRAIKKEGMSMSSMETGIDEILRDDFIDDGDEDDEKDDVKPIIYPAQDTVEKMNKKDLVSIESFKTKNVAEELGYDVQKIAKLIKKEKGIEEPSIPTTTTFEPDCNSEILKFLKNEDSQLLLLQFPKSFTVQMLEDVQRENRNVQNVSTELSSSKNGKKTLSTLPEGCIGKLQILKSGKARLLVGSNEFEIKDLEGLDCKFEAVSIRKTLGEKEMIVLGNIDHKVIVAPGVHNLLNVTN